MKNIKSEFSEFGGVSNNDHGVSRAQGEYDPETGTIVNVRREQPTVTEIVPFRE